MSQVVASLVANIGADTTGFEQGAKKVKGQMTSLASTIGGVLPPSVTQFLSLSGAITVVGVALQSVVKDQIAYANSVRELATIGDTSTEEASRFIQVLDDYKISASEATAASKALKENGMVPTIETLAKLSDAYLAIKDPAEKMKFVQDNLGRGGTKWVEVLNKGSAALLKQNDAVAKNLILTQKMVDDARKAEIAVDSWNDAVKGLKTSLAVGLLPALTDTLNHTLDVARATEMSKEAGVNTWFWLKKEQEKYIELAKAEREQATALMLATGATDKNSGAFADNADAIAAAKSALKDYQDQLDATSQANLDMESMSRTIAQDQKQYADDHTKAVSDLEEAQKKLNEAELLNRDGGDAARESAVKVTIAQRELNDAVAKYGDNSTQAMKKRLALDSALENTNKGNEVVIKAQADVTQAQQAIKDLEVTWHESTQNMIYDMVLAGVSAGGLLDSEQKALDEYAVKAGIKTQADIDEANKRRDIADSTINGILQSEDVLAEQRKVDAETLRLTDATTADAKMQSAAAEAQAIANVTTTTMIEIDAQHQLAQAAIATAAAYSSIPAGGATSNDYYVPVSGGEKGSGPIGSENKAAKKGSAFGGKSPDERDSGGVGIAGTEYMIGIGAQPERFTPAVNGTFTPNADKKLGGTVYNVQINNPVPEKSENSMRNFLKSYSYTGAPE